MTETHAPRFVIIEGSSERTLRESSLTLGRRTSAGVVVRTSGVSRIHATISYRDGRFVVRDAGSTNGTWVDGRRVVEHRLCSGEIIVLGGGEAGGAGEVEIAERGIRVRIEQQVCTLDVPSAARRGSATGGEATAVMARPPTAEVDLPAGFDPESLVVSAPVRGKARVQSGRWVPTSDLAVNRLRRWSVVVLTLVCLAGGLGMLWVEDVQSLTPGE